MTQPLLVPVSAGELLDKKTILEIKQQRLHDPAQQANVRRELEMLSAIAVRELPEHAELPGLEHQLRSIKETLWELENAVRAHERRGDFGDTFTAAARSIYAGNDRRAAVKRQINHLVGSLIVEEKNHGG